MTLFRSFLSLCLVLLSSVGPAACSREAIGPPAGTKFVALQVDGRGLPAVLLREALSEVILLEDRIVFLGDPRFLELTRRWQVRDLRTGSVTTHGGLARTEYRLRGSQLLIGDFGPCDPDAICTAPDTGTLVDETLTLRVGLFGQNMITYGRRQSARIVAA